MVIKASWPGWVHRDDGSFEICIDQSVYSLAAVKKAAYKFADQWSVQFRGGDENHVHVNFCPTHPGSNPDQLGAAFFNEVLDQDLREEIASQTEAVRNLILAHALSQTPLLNQDIENASYEDDPSIEKT